MERYFLEPQLRFYDNSGRIFFQYIECHSRFLFLRNVQFLYATFTHLNSQCLRNSSSVSFFIKKTFLCGLSFCLVAKLSNVIELISRKHLHLEQKENQYGIQKYTFRIQKVFPQIMFVFCELKRTFPQRRNSLFPHKFPTYINQSPFKSNRILIF